MTVTTTERAQNEIWVNPTAGVVFIKKHDHRGELTRDVQVDPGKRVTLTRAEREENMGNSAEPYLDVFRNGTLQPVRILGDDELSRELAANPNAMSQQDMVALVKTRAIKDFAEKLEGIRNVNTLERLLVVAYDEDASVKKVDEIKARIASIREAAQIGARPIQPIGPERGVFGRPVSPR